ncbi:WD40 repeat-like protein, partial [Ramicandelaber brevisporus]
MASSEEEQASVLQLPFVAVQPDWTDDVRAGPKTPPATFWLSVLRSGAATLHADVAVRGDASARSGVRLDALISVPASASASASPSPLSVRLSPASAHELHVAGTGSSLLAELPAAGLRVIAPAATHSTAINGAPLCLDVSPGGELAVLGGSSGQLLVLDGRGSRQRLSLHGHLSDVAVCRFFPSGQVVLSGSGDFQLRIWDALSGACPVVLTGHRRSVTDVAIVERGRNVVSSSLDG